MEADSTTGSGAIRSRESVDFTHAARPTKPEIERLIKLHRSLRTDLVYINGAQTLWYSKATVKGPRRINRQPPTIMLATMHRLSEICRYNPMELASHLAGQKNWLLSEFIRLAPSQFIDEIATELTGYQFLTPNVRPPT